SGTIALVAQGTGKKAGRANYVYNLIGIFNLAVAIAGIYYVANYQAKPAYELLFWCVFPIGFGVCLLINFFNNK
ncbi:MAG TPA: hypothetical protein VKH37_12875, partial [Ferruginibacter sp.]|nr:hypothetical protein [Ferruginibacter sp.]